MILENDICEVSFDLKGAEITSFKFKNNDREYMWPGDEQYWSGRNPILFPIVGNTFSKKYKIDGKEYQMGNHGVCRHLDFELKKQGADYLILSVRSNEWTLNQYPFEFELNVKYQLKDNKLNISYEIINLGDKIMPFTFGLHPAFNVPMEKNETIEQYYLEFEQEEDLKQFLINGDVLEPRKLKKLSLNYDLFEKYPTIIFEGMKSNYVTLTNGKVGVKVAIDKFDYLAFWNGQRAPFVCIEPWYSMADFVENDLKFEDRLGMKKLMPQEKFYTDYSIEIF